jgi:hypothetical protein
VSFSICSVVAALPNNARCAAYMRDVGAYQRAATVLSNCVALAHLSRFMASGSPRFQAVARDPLGRALLRTYVNAGSLQEVRHRSLASSLRVLALAAPKPGPFFASPVRCLWVPIASPLPTHWLPTSRSRSKTLPLRQQRKRWVKLPQCRLIRLQIVPFPALLVLDSGRGDAVLDEGQVRCVVRGMRAPRHSGRFELSPPAECCVRCQAVTLTHRDVVTACVFFLRSREARVWPRRPLPVGLNND